MSKPSSPSRYPDACPSGICPPSDAEAITGTIYRIVKRDPPADADFVTAAELGRYPGQDECLRCGLSVLPTREAAEHARALMPKLGRYIAAARLGPERGMLKQTRKAPHHTWWPTEVCPRHTGFEVR